MIDFTPSEVSGSGRPRRAAEMLRLMAPASITVSVADGGRTLVLSECIDGKPVMAVKKFYMQLTDNEFQKFITLLGEAVSDTETNNDRLKHLALEFIGESKDNQKGRRMLSVCQTYSVARKWQRALDLQEGQTVADYNDCFVRWDIEQQQKSCNSGKGALLPPPEGCTILDIAGLGSKVYVRYQHRFTGDKDPTVMQDSFILSRSAMRKLASDDENPSIVVTLTACGRTFKLTPELVQNVRYGLDGYFSRLYAFLSNHQGYDGFNSAKFAVEAYQAVGFMPPRRTVGRKGALIHNQYTSMQACTNPLNVKLICLDTVRKTQPFPVLSTAYKPCGRKDMSHKLTEREFYWLLNYRLCSPHLIPFADSDGASQLFHMVASKRACDSYRRYVEDFCKRSLHSDYHTSI